MSFGPKVKEWDSSLSAQQLKASGKYNSNSDFAKQFEGFTQNDETRVDDGEGWRELKFDKPPKTAAEYESLVNQWSDAGFDVRAIDMEDGFEHSNIAVKISGKGGDGGTQTPPEELRQMSERLSTAKERVKEYEDRAWSGQSSIDTFGSPTNTDLGTNAASDPESFLQKYKMNFLANQKSKATPTNGNSTEM